MKNNPLDDIIKCDVEISSPASNDVSFDSILMIVPEPSDGDKKKTMSKVTAISSADELLDYGYKATDEVYVAATVAFAQNPAPNELLICIRKKTDEDDQYEDMAVTLARANAESNFYGIHITSFRDKADVAATVSWTEANEKLFGFEYTDYADCPISNFAYYRSFGVFSGRADGYSGDQPAENKYLALAMMAKCFGYDPGTETWAIKELASVVPSGLSTEEKKELDGKNINTFLRYSGSNVTIGGKTLAGEWIDVIRFRDWLKSEMQTNTFNAIKTNRKVPFTDNGIRLIEGKMEETLKAGQDIGGIAPTEYDADDNPIYGYEITVPSVSDLTEAERKSRRLTGCRWSARLAGAIHAVEISGFLKF
jgi:hypothetical protein